jgi:hypothetical protein
MKNKGLKLTAAALAMAFLMGCTQSQILATLEASVAATETLVAALQVSGNIDPTVANEIENAIAGLPAAYRETAAELASLDADGTKSIKIASYYASTVAALNVLPPEAQVYAAAISASIQAFLSDMPQSKDGRALAPAGRAKVTRFDGKQLSAISQRADALGVELNQLKARAAKPAEASR